METSGSYLSWSPPLSDRLSPPLPSHDSYDALHPPSRSPFSHPKSSRLYRAIPIREPFRPAQRFMEPSYHHSSRLNTEAQVAVMKPWPSSELASPRRRLPQTSSVVWGEKRKVGLKKHEENSLQCVVPVQGVQNDSRQTQLSEFKWVSPYEESVLNSHLHDLDPPEQPKPQSTPFLLPDKSTVLVTFQLESLLKSILAHRMIQTVVKFLYWDGGSGQQTDTGVFRYVFCFNRKLPIEKLEECPMETTTVIIAPRDKLGMNVEKAGFDAMHNAIVNIDRVDPYPNSLLPLSAIIHRSSTLSKMTQKPSSSYNSSKKPQMVPSFILSTVDLPPFHDSTLLRKSILSKVCPKWTNSASPTALVTKKAKSGSLRSKFRSDCNYGGGVAGMVLTSKKQLSPYKGIPHRKSLPIGGRRLVEGNAGFRRRPDDAGVRSEHRSRDFGERQLAAGLTSRDSPRRMLRADAKMKKSLIKMSDHILRQMDIQSFCLRYSLTVPDFSRLLEEYSILALTGHPRSSVLPDGIPPHMLCQYYQISLEALRGINPSLFDFPASDSLDVMGVIPLSGVVSWRDFVTFYTLAVTERAELVDLVPFLMRVRGRQYTRVGRVSQLEEEVMMEAMRCRFHPPSQFTETLQRIWSRFTSAIIGERISLSDHTGLIDIDTVTEVAERSQISVLDLRYLVTEIFKGGEAGSE